MTGFSKEGLVSVLGDSYCRKITFQHLTEQGIRSIGQAVELMAEAEQLEAHRNAMSVRRKTIDE